jgi:hypothetical protein
MYIKLKDEKDLYPLLYIMNIFPKTNIQRNQLSQSSDVFKGALSKNATSLAGEVQSSFPCGTFCKTFLWGGSKH